MPDRRTTATRQFVAECYIIPRIDSRSAAVLVVCENHTDCVRYKHKHHGDCLKRPRSEASSTDFVICSESNNR